MNLKPNMYKKNIYSINYEKLKKLGIKNLFFDLDNTIIKYNDEYISDKAIRLLNKLINDGFNVIIFSNISLKNLKKIKTMVNIEIHYNSKKPFKKEYNKVLKKYKKEESAFIGDQIMTDVMGAKRNGLFVIFIDKISENESFGTKILRFFEGFVLRKYNKKNILVKGCYYD